MFTISLVFYNILPINSDVYSVTCICNVHSYINPDVHYFTYIYNILPLNSDVYSVTCICNVHSYINPDVHYFACIYNVYPSYSDIYSVTFNYCVDLLNTDIHYVHVHL